MKKKNVILLFMIVVTSVLGASEVKKQPITYLGIEGCYLVYNDFNMIPESYTYIPCTTPVEECKNLNTIVSVLTDAYGMPQIGRYKGQVYLLFKNCAGFNISVYYGMLDGKDYWVVYKSKIIK